jgi:hypothetical protein
MEVPMHQLLLSCSVAVLLFVPAQHSFADDNDPKALVARAIKAHGGEEKLAHVKTTYVKGKGTVEVMGLSLEFTISGVVQQPGQSKNEISFEIMGMQVTVVHVFNGEKGWMKLNNQVMEVDKEHLAEMKEEMYEEQVQTLVPLLKDKAFTLTALGEDKVNGKPALGVKVASKGHKDVDLYFDKQSGLVVKSVRQSYDPNTKKEVSRETILSDYKDQNGLKFPSKMVMQMDGKKFLDMDVTEYKLIDKLDDSEFGKP